jgi:ketosteroid isomerase-like protein
MNHVSELPVEAQIADLERRWTAAFQHKDVTEMQRYLADGYALIIAVQGERLQIVPRNAWFESLEDYEITEAGIDQIYVRMYGEVAVVSMLWRQKASLHGADRSAQFALTDIWVKQANGWRLAERHSSRPEHPGAARPAATPLECNLCE